jgi:hypothetical protein
MKNDMASLMKTFIDSHLDVAGDVGPDVVAAVKAIRDINRTYSGLKSIEKAVIQRGEKEATGGTSLRGHLSSMFGHGGLIGAGALAMHGNIPGAIAAAVGPKLIEKGLPMAASAGLAARTGANELMERLAQAAAQGNPWAKAQLAAIHASPGAAATATAEQVP